MFQIIQLDLKIRFEINPTNWIDGDDDRWQRVKSPPVQTRRRSRGFPIPRTNLSIIHDSCRIIRRPTGLESRRFHGNRANGDNKRGALLYRYTTLVTERA